MYERILVPTDGSAASEKSLEHAFDLASVHGATIHAVYVVDTASAAGIQMEATWEGVSEMLYGEAESALEDVEARGADRGVAVETAVVEGSPAQEIVRYAERADCDVVVMGTHGRGGIDRLLLGSVAEKVVRSSSVPVLTVGLRSA
jgi:nucleotide-binding universal stress UspA family protein